MHGEGEKCPVENVGYCKCKTRGDGLDITCENVNSNQLNVSEKYILTNKKKFNSTPCEVKLSTVWSSIRMLHHSYSETQNITHPKLCME